MRRACEIPESIQWHEGMLLAPQHFQQLDSRSEEILGYHSKLISPFHRGVHQLTIDENFLRSGKLRVLQLEAIMPDNLLVHHPPPGGTNLELDLTPYAEEMAQREVSVYLAVAARKFDALNRTTDLVRYDSVESAPVSDENTAGDSIHIPRLRPRLILMAGEPPPPKYVFLPLMKIVFKDESFMATDFIPPTLMITKGSALWRVGLDVAQKVREKALYLSEKLRVSAKMQGILAMETKQRIHSLVSSLGYLEGVLYTEKSHPYAVYLALCSMAGQIAGIGTGLVPPPMPAYNHDDPGSAFKAVSGYIFKTVDEGILKAYTLAPFRPASGGFLIKLEKHMVGEKLIVGVKGKPGTPLKDIVEWMKGSLIGSDQMIPSIREWRILGAARKRVEGDENLLPEKDMILYSITPDPEFIVPGEVLAIVNVDDKAKHLPAGIVLYVKNRPGKKGKAESLRLGKKIK